LAEESQPAVLGVQSGAGVVQAAGRSAGQSQGVVEFAVGKQSGVTGDGRAVEFQLDAAVEVNAQGVILAVTHWVPLSFREEVVGNAGFSREKAQTPCRNDRAIWEIRGKALYDQGDLGGAVACYRRALDLDPKHANAHVSLGIALGAKGDLGGAIVCYRQAIDLDPKFALAHGALGQVLLQQGRYAEAREATRRALDLLPAKAALRLAAMNQLQQCDRFLALEKKLPAVLNGHDTPASAADAITLAQMCRRHKNRQAAAARLYADAFATQPRLAADFDRQHRYSAACSAALAAAGAGEDARLLPDRVALMFRAWALQWLRADLQEYTRLAGPSNPAARRAVGQRLKHWQADPDLAPVRGREGLDRLPEAERAAWQALWRDVAELAQRVAEKDR
jgi:tetratricopeptide (TPR) repeat protein